MPTADHTEDHPLGMGALIQEQGVAFRVWAPHADRVSVAGSFNDRSAYSHVMEAEEHGCRFAFIEGAEIGDEYRFQIRNGKQALLKIDPDSSEFSDTPSRDMQAESGNRDSFVGVAKILIGPYSLLIHSQD